jgi:hypothetical protein
MLALLESLQEVRSEIVLSANSMNTCTGHAYPKRTVTEIAALALLFKFMAKITSR